ncbi:MAG: hypothetical protein ACTHKZ_03720 [Lysobacteraceae bacterium]
MDAFRIRHAVAAACLLLAAAWLVRGLYAQAPARRAARRPAASAPHKVQEAATPAMRMPAGQATASEPLPPADAPVTQVFDALRRRADAGDARAACRLAVDLQRCRDLPLLQAMAAGTENGKDAETSFAREGNLAAANFFAGVKLRLLEAQARCRDITPAQVAFAPQYLRQAAHAGIPDAIVRYVDGKGFEPMSMYGMLHDARFDAWRREAPALAMQALRQGEPKAVFLLHVAYSSDQSLFAGLVPDDPVQARAFRLLLERLKGEPGRSDDALPPAQQEAAEARADRMYREDFHGRPLSGGQRAAFDTAIESAFSAGTDDCR